MDPTSRAGGREEAPLTYAMSRSAALGDRAAGTGAVRQDLAYDLIKRLFDVLLCLCALPVLIPVMLVLAVVIPWEDPGPPFFVQQRVGRGGRMFPMVKFRTMKVGAEDLEAVLSPEELREYGRSYKLKDDPRLIGADRAGDRSRCFGAVLRRTSADELPQILWNVLIRNDMSIVGPRPILRRELEEHYTPEEQALLQSVKPGLTGYWQAYARNEVSYEDGARQAMELYYVRERSLLLDGKILFATVGRVLSRKGAS